MEQRTWGSWGEDKKGDEKGLFAVGWPWWHRWTFQSSRMKSQKTLTWFQRNCSAHQWGEGQIRRQGQGKRPEGTLFGNKALETKDCRARIDLGNCLKPALSLGARAQAVRWGHRIPWAGQWDLQLHLWFWAHPHPEVWGPARPVLSSSPCPSLATSLSPSRFHHFKFHLVPSLPFQRQPILPVSCITSQKYFSCQCVCVWLSVFTQMAAYCSHWSRPHFKKLFLLNIE